MEMQGCEQYDLVGTEGLQHRLETQLGKQRDGVAVAVYQRGAIHTAAMNGYTTDSAVQTGCIAKSLTATLVAIAESEGLLCLGDSVGSGIDGGAMPTVLAEHLAQTRLHHLLSHTSGLDHSTLGNISRRSDGWIDVKSLLDEVAQAGVIAPPGRLFGYSSIGAWIAAGILEHRYGQPYRDVLHERLFAPLGINALSDLSAQSVCPSFGGELRLSADGLMKLALLHLRGDPHRPRIDEHLQALHRTHPFDLPEMPLGGVRAYPGWFDFGNGFGHSGHGDASSGVLRFMPAQDAAIVIAAGHPMLAKTTMALLFKESLDEYRRIGSLKPQPAEQWARTDPKPYTGTFENAKYRLSLDIAANGSLRARAYRKQGECGGEDAEPYVKRYFKAMAPGTFIPVPAESKVCPVLLYSERAPDGLFNYLGTNLYSFRRTA